MAYVSINSATNVITCARLCLKQMWRLTKAKTEWNLNTEQRYEIGVPVQNWLGERVEHMAW